MEKCIVYSTYAYVLICIYNTYIHINGFYFLCISVYILQCWKMRCTGESGCSLFKRLELVIMKDQFHPYQRHILVKLFCHLIQMNKSLCLPPKKALWNSFLKLFSQCEAYMAVDYIFNNKLWHWEWWKNSLYNNWKYSWACKEWS